MISQILKSARYAVKFSAAIALFWFAYYLFFGPVPESTLLVHISHWWDIVLAPLFVICFSIFDAVDDEEWKNVTDSSSGGPVVCMFLALVFGLLFGLIIGMIFLYAAMFFVFRTARKLHRYELEKNAQIPSVVVVSEESINKEIEERWRETDENKY